MNLFHSLHPVVSLYVLIGKNPKIITPMWVGVSQTVGIYLGSGWYLNKSFPVATRVVVVWERNGCFFWCSVWLYKIVLVVEDKISLQYGYYRTDRTDLTVHMCNVHMCNVHMCNVHMCNVHMCNVHMCNVHMYNVHMCNVHICNVLMCNVHMCNVHMCNVHMYNVHMCNVHMCNVYRCNVHMCNVYMCNVHMCNVHMCNVCVRMNHVVCCVH